MQAHNILLRRVAMMGKDFGLLKEDSVAVWFGSGHKEKDTGL
jgi:hypothetical protein